MVTEKILQLVLTIYISVLFLSDKLCAIKSSRTMEGYPVGYLSDCPGSTKEIKITNSSLKHLSFILLGEGNFLTAKKPSFNYFQMKELARHMDFRKNTIVYMNGYMDSSYLMPITPAMGSLYTRMGYSVLLLEYIWFSAAIYPRAARYLRSVGKRTAEMLADLTTYGLDPKKVQVMGLSHGGQGISFIAKNYRRITGMNVSRVTALDPSGPCFRRLGPEDRIDASDADFVDVIHTNIDGYGMAAPVGHVDFYVNGGEFQINDIPEIPCSSFCSHTRSYVLWVVALQYPDSFIGIQCDSIQDARDRNCYDRLPLITNVMGPKTDRTKPGIFFLPTQHFYPYYLGLKGLRRDKEPYALYMNILNADNVVVL